MVLWIIAAFAGYFVKGVCGFANTLVLTGIMSFGADNVNITPVDLVLSYGANAAMAYKERAHIKWRVAAPLAALVLLGCLPGAFMLKTGNAGIIKLAAGGAIILAALVMLVKNLKAAGKLKAGKATQNPTSNTAQNPTGNTASETATPFEPDMSRPETTLSQSNSTDTDMSLPITTFSPSNSTDTDMSQPITTSAPTPSIGSCVFRQEAAPRSSDVQSTAGKLLTLLIAVVSGILSGLYGIGALMSVCVSRVTENSHEFKANMSLIFFAEGTFRLILYTCIGIMTGQLFLRGLILLPVSLAGLFCGMKLSTHIDEAKAKYVVIFFLILSGIVLIVNNL